MKFLILLISVFTSLFIDSFGAYLSRKLRFEYAWLAPISFSVYFLCGYFSIRYTNFWVATSHAAFVGLIDSTAGWYISSKIGSYSRFDTGIPEKTIHLGAVIFMIALTGALGALGAYFGK